MAQWHQGLLRRLALPGPASLNDVRQKPQEPRALDGAGEFALLERRHRGDAARYDLAALGNVTLQQPHVLVVDFRCVGAREWAGLAPSEERPARAAAETAPETAAASAFIEAHGVIAPSSVPRRRRR